MWKAYSLQNYLHFFIPSFDSLARLEGEEEENTWPNIRSKFHIDQKHIFTSADASEVLSRKARQKPRHSAFRIRSKYHALCEA